MGAAAAALAQRNSEERGQPSRMLLERFNSQEFDGAGRRAGDAGVTHRAVTLGCVWIAWRVSGSCTMVTRTVAL